MTNGYQETYDRWRTDPQAFWAEAAREIRRTKPPQSIFDRGAGDYGRWFPDARCNACFNALDRHVEAGRCDQAALYYDSPVTAAKRTISYHELLDETATLGAVLEDFGAAAGDWVLIYMPMNSRGGRRHARLCADRGRAFGGVRRLRGQGTGDAHR